MKSIFGFKILSSWQSIFSTYFFIISQHILEPMFGTNQAEIVSGGLFNIIIYLSILILVLNSILQKRKPYIYLWIIAITPLIVLIPIILNRLLFSLNQIMSLII